MFSPSYVEKMWRLSGASRYLPRALCFVVSTRRSSLKCRHTQLGWGGWIIVEWTTNYLRTGGGNRKCYYQSEWSGCIIMIGQPPAITCRDEIRPIIAPMQDVHSEWRADSMRAPGTFGVYPPQKLLSFTLFVQSANLNNNPFPIVKWSHKSNWVMDYVDESSRIYLKLKKIAVPSQIDLFGLYNFLGVSSVGRFLSSLLYYSMLDDCTIQFWFVDH